MQTTVEAPAAAAVPVPTLAPGAADLQEPGRLTQPREQARRQHTTSRVPAYAAVRPFVAASALEQAAERFMLFNDPPMHTRLRRVVGAAFTPAAASTLAVSIGAAGEVLLDGRSLHHSSRYKLRNDFFRADGQLAAKVTSMVGFLDLDARQLVVPPAEVLAT